MLLGRLKTESVIEVFHHALDICLGASFKNLVVGLGLFYNIKMFSEEVIWIWCLLDSEPLFSDRVK